MNQPAQQSFIVQPWQPAARLADVAAHVIEKASKLQRALARALARDQDTSISRAEWECIALDDYEKEFGHRITPRAIRTLLKRTLDRDAGALNFSRLEIYLPEKPALKHAPKPVISLTVESQFRHLHDAIAAFQNPAKPSLEEKSYLWLLAFEAHDEKIGEGKAPKKVRCALLEFLARNAPFLVNAGAAPVKDLLRIAFKRKYDRWLESEQDAAALVDARAEKSGRFRAPEISDADRDALIAHATMNCGGRIAQAWRELIQSNKLSETIISYYLSNPASKSYVPRRIMDSVKHEIDALYNIHHGPRQHKLNGAYLSRDWSSVAAGDWWQADDATMPIYYYVPDGNGWFTLMRGQTLLMIDLRTTRILGFVLISQRNYNANAIRTLTTKVADEYGLPRKGFYFENGIWRAKIIKGSENENAVGWADTEMGLREFGLRFVHARLPRAKPIEGIMGATQNLMEGLPGYVGRNEQTEKFERVQKQILQVNNRKLHPQGIFMDAAQWENELEKICQRYNATKQDGKMTGGLSPDEAFEKFANLADPPVKFTPECRFLLAHHKRPVKVTAKSGISFRCGSQTFGYLGEETKKLIGQTVLVWFNPELPDILTVTDMNRKNPFTIERKRDVPAMDASPEIMAQEMSRIAAHQSYAVSRYRTLRSNYAIQFRPMLADRETIELGAQIGEQRSTAMIQLGENARMEKRTRNATRKVGMIINDTIARRPETAPAAELLSELLADETETKDAQ